MRPNDWPFEWTKPFRVILDAFGRRQLGSAAARVNRGNVVVNADACRPEQRPEDVLSVPACSFDPQTESCQTVRLDPF